MFHIGFNEGTRKASFPHDFPHTRIIQDGDDELLHLYLHRRNELVLVLVLVLMMMMALYRASPLVSLGALEGRQERVGKGEVLGRRGREAVECNVEAELQGFAVEGVGMGAKAGGSKKAI